MHSARAKSRLPSARGVSGWASRTVILTVVSGLVVLAVCVVRLSKQQRPAAAPEPDAAGAPRTGRATAAVRSRPVYEPQTVQPLPAAAQVEAGRIVADKTARFARQRRELARRLADKLGRQFTPEMEQFFEAAEAGNWEQTEALGKTLLGAQAGGDGDGTAPRDELRVLLHETFCVAEVAHKWPARALLDYGNRILGSLDPDTVYVGGTDPGRFIPTLLNETGDGRPRIILTQNQLADRAYVEYVNFLYGDRLSGLTPEDSHRAFTTYLEDAAKRAHHDRQFPNEPRQVRPNEQIEIVNNRVQVSGQAAVMDINGRLLQALMARNPEARFVLEESFPIASTYAGAIPVGPLIALNALPDGAVMPAEAAKGALHYWESGAAALTTDPAWSESPDVRAAYSKLAQGHANLLAHQHYLSEAEQLYTVARRLAPEALEPLEQSALFLGRLGRRDEALRLLDSFMEAHPDRQADVRQVRQRLLGQPVNSSAP